MGVPAGAARGTASTQRAVAACTAVGLRTPPLLMRGLEGAGRGLAAGSGTPMRLLVWPLE